MSSASVVVGSFEDRDTCLVRTKNHSRTGNSEVFWRKSVRRSVPRRGNVAVDDTRGSVGIVSCGWWRRGDSGGRRHGKLSRDRGLARLWALQLLLHTPTHQGRLSGQQCDGHTPRPAEESHPLVSTMFFLL